MTRATAAMIRRLPTTITTLLLWTAGCALLRPIVRDCAIAGCPADKICAAETHTCVPRPAPEEKK